MEYTIMQKEILISGIRLIIEEELNKTYIENGVQLYNHYSLTELKEVFEKEFELIVLINSNMEYPIIERCLDIMEINSLKNNNSLNFKL